MSEQWVQSKYSKDAIKWKIHFQSSMAYYAWHPNMASAEAALLPKSEYDPCEPPERWEDVTGECSTETCDEGESKLMHDGRCIAYASCHGDSHYRFVGQPLRIERKVQR